MTNLLSVELNGRRRFDRIFVSARRSLEPSILLDRQCSMENIAFNDTGAIYLDAVGADGALKVAADYLLQLTHFIARNGGRLHRHVWLDPSPERSHANRRPHGPMASRLSPADI